MTAVFLGFGFVFAQSQAHVGMLLRESLAQTQKSALRVGYNFSSKALVFESRINLHARLDAIAVAGKTRMHPFAADT